MPTTDGLRKRAERLRATLDSLRPPQAPTGRSLEELGDPRLVELYGLIDAQQRLDQVEEAEALGPYLAGAASLPDPGRLHLPAYQHDGVRRMPMVWQLQLAREFSERYVRARRRVELDRRPPAALVAGGVTNGHRGTGRR
jgi:hypothetical protein